jgi:hypothetical protein
MYSVSLDRIRRTIRFRASGVLTSADMRQVAEEAQWCYDQFKGAHHLVLADMRGMAPLKPEAAQMFGEVIKYGRSRGTVCCAHLSDSSIARLQAARLAREASKYDDVTIDVASPEEAEKVIEEQLVKMGIKVR